MNVKEKLQALLAASNTTTGETDSTLTDAVQSLIDGYGGGGVQVYSSNYAGVAYFADTVIPDRETANTTTLSNVYFGAVNMKRVYIGANVKTGNQWFKDCTGLEEAYVNCQTNSEMFWNCSNLSKVVLLDNAEIISNYTFDSCRALMTVIIPRNSVMPLTTNNIFVATSQFTTAAGQGRIYVPRSQISAYESATNWSAYAGHYLAIEDYPEIATWEEWWK